MTSDVQKLVERPVRSDIGANGIVAFAEFGGSWAEKKWVTVVLGKTVDGETILGGVQAAYDTDYGFYLGSSGGKARSHWHGDMLCFDLVVVRNDGSGIKERWQGEMKVR